MKFPQIAHKLIKSYAMKKRHTFIMLPYFIFETIPFGYQKIRTKLKDFFRSADTAVQIYIYFYNFVFKFCIL